MYQVVESFVDMGDTIRKRVMMPDGSTVILGFKSEPTQDEIDAIIDKMLEPIPELPPNVNP